MKKYSLFLLFCCFNIFFSVAFAVDPATSLESTLAHIQTIQADFSEVILTGDHVNQRLSGVFYLKKVSGKPGKFVWKTKQPIHQEIISNGEKIWIYDKDLEQVTISSLKKNVGATPVLLLNGEKGDIAQHYVVTVAPQDTHPSTLVYTLAPKQKALYRFIQMSFEGEKLIRMRFEDNLGQFTDFAFTHIRLNKPISDKPFIFIPPKNIDIIHE